MIRDNNFPGGVSHIEKEILLFVLERHYQKESDRESAMEIMRLPAENIQVMKKIGIYDKYLDILMRNNNSEQKIEEDDYLMKAYKRNVAGGNGKR